MIIKPHINLNGTSAEALKDQYLEAYHKLDHAVDALRMAVPHGRDYKSLEEYTVARNEHSERIKQVQAIRDQMYELAIHADEHVKG